MTTRRPKVLYLYAGKRTDFYALWKAGKNPDTQLLGLNYMDKLGVDAEFLEWPLAEWLRKINFNLTHLAYIFAIRRYDVVFICAGLPLVFLAKYVLHWKKPKFVIYNTFLTNALKRNRRGIAGFMTRWTIAHLDMIVCTAREQKDFLIAEGFDPAKIIFSPIGIDAERFRDTSRGLSSGNEGSPHSPYILAVGRDLGRDYQTLFTAVKDLPIVVKVATKQEAIDGLEIPSNVEILLNVPYEQMPTLYDGALFSVVPLRDWNNPTGSDTSGQYGYLEPMAAGKAVIVSDKTVVRDYVENNVDGILVAPENPLTLREAIKKLIADEELRARLGHAAQKKVLAQFTGAQFATTLAHTFKQVLK